MIQLYLSAPRRICIAFATLLSLVSHAVFADVTLYSQNFNTCTGLFASGWTTFSIPVGASWTLGTPTNPDAMGSTMNGSCFLYFDDDLMGSNALPNGVWLRSAAINTADYAKITLEFDLHFRAHDVLTSSLEVYASTSTTVSGNPIAIYRESVTGNLYSQNAHQVLDISAYRGATTYIFFLYKDGGGQSWWAGIDNFVINGTSSVTCANAETITAGSACTIGANSPNTFNGALPSCNTNTDGAVWYKFTAPSAAVTINTHAAFNDILTVFGGTCAGLTEIACQSNDLYGFEGESKYLTGLSTGNTYYLRLSGITNTFGATQGSFCLEVLNGGSTPAPPGNDLCSNAIPLALNQTCTNANANSFAGMENPLPSLDNKADHSIWYTFAAPASGNVKITSNADFSDVLTLFSGSCAGTLTEVAGTDMGRELRASGLTPSATYYLQVSSNFNSVMGSVCVAVQSLPAIPANDACANAVLLTVGAANCTPGTNLMATMDGPNPSCEIFPDASIWYRFVAPASGKIRINSGAEFVHNVALYSGSCGSLTPFTCLDNPNRCGAPTLITGLTPAATYYIQITSAKNPFGYVYGDVCVRITDGNITPVKTKVKAIPEGLYNLNTGLLNTTLNSLGVIPTEQPFNQPPWNYAGSECINIPPANMADWVLLELRSAANSNTVIDRKAALLLTDGTIADSGDDGVTFLNAASGNYYIAVRHRNHIAVLSSAAVTLPNTATYSFSSAAGQAMGANQLKNMGNGIYALRAGDFNADGVATVADFNLFMAESSGINGYFNADANADRMVTIADFNLYQPNAGAIGMPQIRY
ncbi:hypothetical protein C7N43_13350 [Sphingobacteriales bacterium UPWRP_1]|nr:hypothetical protein B6N25_03485 [Sphingobacteriales bacterium TSM_CSS]PSJ76515.1 hypothetical protein C7N43_13350 [Sphingobacteriales bacterium UPWRP_1]